MLNNIIQLYFDRMFTGLLQSNNLCLFIGKYSVKYRKNQIPRIVGLQKSRDMG